MRKIPVFLTQTLEEYCSEMFNIFPPLTSSLQSIVWSLQNPWIWERFAVQAQTFKRTDRRLHILASFRREHCLGSMHLCNASNLKLLSYVHMDDASLSRWSRLPWTWKNCDQVIEPFVRHYGGRIATLWSQNIRYDQNWRESDYCFLGDKTIPESVVILSILGSMSFAFPMFPSDEELLAGYSQAPRGDAKSRHEVTMMEDHDPWSTVRTTKKSPKFISFQGEPSLNLFETCPTLRDLTLDCLMETNLTLDESYSQHLDFIYPPHLDFIYPPCAPTSSPNIDGACYYNLRLLDQPYPFLPLKDTRDAYETLSHGPLALSQWRRRDGNHSTSIERLFALREFLLINTETELHGIHFPRLEKFAIVGGKVTLSGHFPVLRSLILINATVSFHFTFRAPLSARDHT